MGDYPSTFRIIADPGRQSTVHSVTCWESQARTYELNFFALSTSGCRWTSHRSRRSIGLSRCYITHPFCTYPNQIQYHYSKVNTFRIDDIQDNSQLRRGFPVAHHVFGSARTINSANYAYFLAQQELFSLPNWPEAIRIFSEELLNLHRGQGMELFWRDTLTVPTETEYYDMISKKTGALFCLGARLLQSLSSTKIDLLPLVCLLGLVFQICDDYKNLFSDHVSPGIPDQQPVAADVKQMTDVKGYCEDLTEGKFSFPIIHAIRSSASANNDVLNILRLHTTDAKLKADAVWYMRTVSKSKNYTALVVRHLYEEARKLMEAMSSENDLLNKIMDKIIDDCCDGG